MGPRIAWYGDDFTGATDTLATLTQAGLRAILFLDVPTLEQQSRAGDALGGELDAIGIAGATRAMAPAQIARTLAPVASYFASLRPDVLHYKVCSTFDSAPQVGNIAAAVRALRPYVGNPLVPIVAGQPNLGRYCAFSNLFASAGAGREVQRLDRHPTMRNHPVTPMREADLRRHLELQGLQPLAALHYPLYSQPKDVQDAAVARAIESGAGGLLMDVADASHLAAAGRILWRQAGRGRVLAVGSSVVAQALIAHWRESGEVLSARASAKASRSDAPVFVLAGSLSPVTAAQVRAARSYEHIALSPAELGQPLAACERISAALAAGRNVLACTAPPDSLALDTAHTGDIAAATAQLLEQVVRLQFSRGRPLARIGIAGGDTSSRAVQALPLWGLSYAGLQGEGVCISRAHSDDAALDGVQLMLKGGQMGAESVFDDFARG